MAMTQDELKAYRRAWYQANKADVLARVKARAIAKREEIRVYKKEYWARNKPALHAKQRTYYVANKAMISAKFKDRYAANPEPLKAKSKSYRRTHPEQTSAVQRTWREANRARLALVKKKWRRADCLANPEKYREKQGRRKALKRNSEVGKVDFKKVLRDSKGLCGICGKPLDLFGIDFDHVIPLARGGAHVTANIQATHSRCNRSKGAKVG